MPPVPSTMDEHPLIYREWSPLLALLSKIPSRVHRGLFGYDLNLTCVAAHPRFLVLGTNAGLVYWYDRQKQDLARLWCEDRVSPITHVALVETVDFMVAAGNKEGGLAIFQIPRPPVDPNLPPPSTVTERYTITGVHGRSISALAWAINGMKLFSGDLGGKVCLTDFDFVSNTTRSKEIHREESEIVQLSYTKHKLLISSFERTVLCLTGDEYKIIPIGSRDRRPGPYGGLLRAGLPTEAVVVRPNNRLFAAGVEGGVLRTIILRALIEAPHMDIPVVNPTIFSDSKDEEEDKDFFFLEEFEGNLLVAFNFSAFHIVDTEGPRLLASCNSLRRIIDLSVTSSGEIFVLEGPRSLIRIAKNEDPFRKENINEILNPLGEDRPEGTGLESITNFVSESVSSKIPTIKLPDTPTLMKSNIGSTLGNLFRRGPDNVEQAEEVGVEQDPSLDGAYKDRMDQIGHQEFERKFVERKRGRRKEHADRKEHRDSLSNSDSDLLAPDSSDLSEMSGNIQGSLVKLRLELHSPPEDSVPEASPSHTPIEDLPHDDEGDQGVANEGGARTEGIYDGGETSGGETLSSLELKEEALAKTLQLDKFLTQEERTNVDDASLDEDRLHSTESGRTMPYGPPSGSSISTVAHLSLDSERFESNSSGTAPSPFPGAAASQDTSTATPMPQYQHWHQFSLPSDCTELCVVKDVLCSVDSRHCVFYSPINDPSQLTWRKASYQASKIISSPSGNMVWKICQNVAYAFKSLTPKTVESNGSVIEVSVSVQDATLTDSSAWIVKETGRVTFQKDLSPANLFATETEIVGEERIVKIFSGSDHTHIWAINYSRTLLVRIGTTLSTPEGSEWIPIKSLEHLKVDHVAIRDSGSFMVVTSDGTVLHTMSKHKRDEDFAEDETVVWSQIFLGDSLSAPPSHRRFPAHAPALARGHASLWLSNGKQLFGNRQQAEGHIWRHRKFHNVTMRLKEIMGKGLFEHSGILWVFLFSMSPSGELYYTAFHDAALHKIDLPRSETCLCLGVAPEAAWLLTSSGRIYIRKNIRPEKPAGTGWTKLDLTQLKSTETQLTHLSLGSDVVWACDSAGKVYMRLGPLTPPKDSAVPVWIPVDSGEESIRFVKVFASTESHIVWAIDNKHNVYVREGIFPDFRLGSSWLLVPGIEAVQLAASDSAVWALTPNGRVFRRCGIDKTNFVGEAWRPLPGTASLITVSVCDQLYSLDREGRLVEHLVEDIPIDPSALVKPKFERAETVDDDWTLVT